MKALRAVGLVAPLALSACAIWPFAGEPEEAEPRPAADASYGIDVVDAGVAADFHVRTQSFYEQMSDRRFNSLATYHDPDLRAFFRSEQAFSDYYADLAQALVDTNFEKNRPLAAEVVEWSFDGPGRAQVTVVMKGDNGLPLRWWETVLERVDRWERTDGRWWVVPGKL